jgi:hypothetical protein
MTHCKRVLLFPNRKRQDRYAAKKCSIILILIITIIIDHYSVNERINSVFYEQFMCCV